MLKATCDGGVLFTRCSVSYRYLLLRCLVGADLTGSLTNPSVEGCLLAGRRVAEGWKACKMAGWYGRGR
jgi:hypothetical protein